MKSLSPYDTAEKWCRDVVKNGNDFLFDVNIFDDEIRRASNDLGFQVESLTSFLRNTHLKHVKKNSNSFKYKIESLIEKDYMEGGLSILGIARKINYPPSMVARSVIEHVVSTNAADAEHDHNGSSLGTVTTTGGTNVRSKKFVTEAMRDPARMLSSPEIISQKYLASEETFNESTCTDNSLDQNTTRLAREVVEAINKDPLYGPRLDKERNFVGVEYEILLEQGLRSMNIPFETEGQLRIRGTARTPDVLLSYPIAIQIPKRNELDSEKGQNSHRSDHASEVGQAKEGFEWKMICWIDSKALFGDINTHQYSVLPQAEKYVHRFGPGLILYWFGHAPRARLGNSHGDVVIAGWTLPNVAMLPNGEIISGRSS